MTDNNQNTQNSHDVTALLGEVADIETRRASLLQEFDARRTALLKELEGKLSYHREQIAGIERALSAHAGTAPQKAPVAKRTRVAPAPNMSSAGTRIPAREIIVQTLRSSGVPITLSAIVKAADARGQTIKPGAANQAILGLVNSGAVVRIEGGPAFVYQLSKSVAAAAE